MKKYRHARNHKQYKGAKLHSFTGSHCLVPSLVTFLNTFSPYVLTHFLLIIRSLRELLYPSLFPSISPPPQPQCVGCVLIGLGAWFEILDQNFEAIVDGDQLVYGAYLTIASGCAIIVLSVIGIFGAICDYKANRVLLFVVSFGSA